MAKNISDEEKFERNLRKVRKKIKDISRYKHGGRKGSRY